MRLTDLVFRVRTLFSLTAAERDLKDEFEFHLQMERDKLIAQGMPASEADAEARRRFGGVTRESQRARDQWGIGVMRDLASDVRHAFRQFRRRPAFTIAGTLTLAIGIGATVSLFSVVRGTLLRPLPVTREQDVRVFWQDYNWRASEYVFLRPRLKAFADIAGYSINGYTLTRDEGAVTTLSGVVTANLFDVLGATPALGRTFAAGADQSGAEQQVVLGWRIWQRTFAGDSSIVGRRIELDGRPVTVIGVMPKHFYFPTPEIEMWRPVELNPAGPMWHTGWLVVVGRAKAGISDADVSADIREMAVALGKEFTYPAAWDKTKDAHTTLLREYLQGSVRPVLMLLLGAVFLLLLMACANVAALVLSRTADRIPEMSLRTALGANRGRLARQIIAESVALSTLAGVFGAALAALTFGVLVRSLPLRDGLGTTLGIDWSMFALAFVASAVIGLVVAAAPVRSVLGGQLRGVGNERSAQGMRGGHKRFHSAMVVAEMALGVTLAAGALLLVRSVSHLYAQETGFDAAGVVTLDVLTPRAFASEARLQLVNDLTARARAIPGVQNVGFVSRLPVRDGGWQGTVQSASRPDIERAAAPNSFIRVVSEDYFETMGIRIVRGRAFNETDRAGVAPVAIVSESFAKRMWPGQDPIGQLIEGANAKTPNWATVVGIAEESRIYRMVGDNPPCWYSPIAQNPGNASLVLVAKTTGSAGAAMAALRAAVSETDKRAAVGRVITMEDVVKVSLADRLQLRFFLSLFATLALVLGAIGVYGVVSYAVTRRRAEFGVRMALGASSSRVMNDVAIAGLKPVATGIAIGVCSSLVLCRFVAQFLYGVPQRDVLSIGGAAAALLLAGVLAVLIPGLRAGRTSPMEVLRAD